jgi:hypothetical protein
MRVTLALEEEPGAAPLEIPWQSAAGRYLDLRENPHAIAEIEPARRHLPLSRFLAALNSDDSIFATLRCHVADRAAETSALGEFHSRFHLVFADFAKNLTREALKTLALRLRELLEKDSPAESLEAELRLARCRFKETGGHGYGLAITLRATGGTPQQAELRWSLGLMRVQQALLYLSRVMRHHTPSPE